METTRCYYIMLMAVGNIGYLHMLSSKTWNDCGGKVHVQGVLEGFTPSCQDLAAMSANTVIWC